MIAKVAGTDAWTAFKNEVGKHCVQRISPTESKGRKHTSMISVGVLPLPDEKFLRKLKDSELDITFQNGHGKGGQHQNATQSACRIVHKETKLQVFINGRDQHANRREAIKIITARVNNFEQEKVEKAYNSDRKAQLGDGGRGNKVRTYNFLKGFAIDHRTGKKTGNIKQLMKGDIELLI